MTGFVKIRSASQRLSVAGTLITLDPDSMDRTAERPFVGEVHGDVVSRLLQFPYGCEVVAAPGRGDDPRLQGGSHEPPAPPMATVAPTAKVEAIHHQVIQTAVPVVTPPTLYPHPFRVGDIIRTPTGEVRISGFRGSEVLTEPIAASVAA